MAIVPRNFFHSKLFPVISSAHLHFWEISCHFLFDFIMCCNCHLLRFPFRPTPCHVDRLHLWLPFATLKLWRQYHPFSNRRFWQQNVQPFRRKAGRGGQEIGSFFLIRWKWRRRKTFFLGSFGFEKYYQNFKHNYAQSNENFFLVFDIDFR